MKKLLVVLLVLAVGVIGTLAVQKYILKSPGPAAAGQTIDAAEENSFNLVTRNLDPGGTFYMYLGTHPNFDRVNLFVGYRGKKPYRFRVSI